MLDDDLARKILEREIFLSSVYGYRGDIARNDRFPFRSLIGYIYIYIYRYDAIEEGGRREGWLRFRGTAMQIYHVAWLGCKLTRQPPPVIAVHALKSARREYSSRWDEERARTRGRVPRAICICGNNEGEPRLWIVRLDLGSISPTKGQFYHAKMRFEFEK